MANTFEASSMTLKNGMTLLFKDGKARDLLDKKYGPDNPPPDGVPPGGLSGQVLKKNSAADFDTYWGDESGGGGGAVYYQTTAEWALTPQLIAQRGVIYVYSDKAYIEDGEGNITFIPGMKVGDGTSYLIDMPFIADDISARLSAHVMDSAVHVTAAERAFWNNKVSSYMDTVDEENLILSKTNYILEE